MSAGEDPTLRRFTTAVTSTRVPATPATMKPRRPQRAMAANHDGAGRSGAGRSGAGAGNGPVELGLVAVTSRLPRRAPTAAPGKAPAAGRVRGELQGAPAGAASRRGSAGYPAREGRSASSCAAPVAASGRRDGCLARNDTITDQ